MCRGRRHLKFFSQRLGQLGWTDCDALLALDFHDQARDRPVPPVGDRGVEQRRDDPQCCLGLHRRRTRIHTGPDALDAATEKIAPPEADGILAHAKHLGDPRAGPALERQQDGTRPISLAPLARRRQRFERRNLLFVCLDRRFARHVPPPRISAKTESQSRFVGQVDEVCLATPVARLHHLNSRRFHAGHSRNLTNDKVIK